MSKNILFDNNKLKQSKCKMNSMQNGDQNINIFNKPKISLELLLIMSSGVL